MTIRYEELLHSPLNFMIRRTNDATGSRELFFASLTVNQCCIKNENTGKSRDLHRTKINERTRTITQSNPLNVVFDRFFPKDDTISKLLAHTWVPEDMLCDATHLASLINMILDENTYRLIRMGWKPAASQIITSRNDLKRLIPRHENHDVSNILHAVQYGSKSYPELRFTPTRRFMERNIGLWKTPSTSPERALNDVFASVYDLLHIMRTRFGTDAVIDFLSDDIVARADLLQNGYEQIAELLKVRERISFDDLPQSVQYNKPQNVVYAGIDGNPLPPNPLPTNKLSTKKNGDLLDFDYTKWKWYLTKSLAYQNVGVDEYDHMHQNVRFIDLWSNNLKLQAIMNGSIDDLYPTKLVTKTDILDTRLDEYIRKLKEDEDREERRKWNEMHAKTVKLYGRSTDEFTTRIPDSMQSLMELNRECHGFTVAWLLSAIPRKIATAIALESTDDPEVKVGVTLTKESTKSLGIASTNPKTRLNRREKNLIASWLDAMDERTRNELLANTEDRMLYRIGRKPTK